MLALEAVVPSQLEPNSRYFLQPHVVEWAVRNHECSGLFELQPASSRDRAAQPDDDPDAATR